MKHTPDAIVNVAAESNLVKAVFLYVAFSLTVLLLAILWAAQVFAEPTPQEKTEAAQTRADQPVELGDVQWLRDLDTAVASSKKQNKPIAILFQEVPG